MDYLCLTTGVNSFSQLASPDESAVVGCVRLPLPSSAVATPASPLEAVSTGWTSTTVAHAGSVYQWGLGLQGEVWHAPKVGETPTGVHANVSLAPVPLAGEAPVAVVSGAHHTVIASTSNTIIEDGKPTQPREQLRIFGRSGNGHDHHHVDSAGRPHPAPRLRAMDLPLSVQIRTLSAGAAHTLILDTHGRVWSFGANDQQQLGRYTAEPEGHLPELVAGLGRHPGIGAAATASQAEFSSDPVVRISSGWNHNAAVTRSGHCYMWGANAYQQCGSDYQPQAPSNSAPSSSTAVGTQPGQQTVSGSRASSSSSTGSSGGYGVSPFVVPVPTRITAFDGMPLPPASLTDAASQQQPKSPVAEAAASGAGQQPPRRAPRLSAAGETEVGLGLAASTELGPHDAARSGAIGAGTGGSTAGQAVPLMFAGPSCGIVSTVSCGAWHTAIVSSSGDVYTLGNASHGALGHIYPLMHGVTVAECEEAVGTDKLFASRYELGCFSGIEPNPRLLGWYRLSLRSIVTRLRLWRSTPWLTVLPFAVCFVCTPLSVCCCSGGPPRHDCRSSGAGILWQ